MARPALAATRAMEVLRFLAAHPTDSFTLTELSEHLGINGASIHAVLQALVQAGTLCRHPVHRTYGLGPAVIALGHAALERHRAVDRARDEMRRLGQELDLELLATVVVGEEMLAVARAGPHQPAPTTLRMGQRVPLVPPLGLVFLAWAEEPEVAAWLSRAGIDARGAEAKPYRELLAAVRRRGYSVALRPAARGQLGEVVAHLAEAPHDAALRARLQHWLAELGREDYQLSDMAPGARYDVSLVGAPVFDSRGRVALALWALGFRAPLGTPALLQLAERVRGAALLVTRATHGTVPPARGQNP